MGPAGVREGDRWWRALSESERREFMDRHESIARDWGQAAKDGLAADSAEAQAIAARHCDWLSTTSAVTRSYVIGVSAMYVTDPRYGRNYDKYEQGAAVLVRDAMTVYAERHLAD